MPQQVDVRIPCRADQPPSDLLLALVEALVEAGDHHVQLRQKLIRKIEPAVLQNIHLHPGEQPEVRPLLLQPRID